MSCSKPSGGRAFSALHLLGVGLCRHYAIWRLTVTDKAGCHSCGDTMWKRQPTFLMCCPGRGGPPDWRLQCIACLPVGCHSHQTRPL